LQIYNSIGEFLVHIGFHTGKTAARPLTSCCIMIIACIPMCLAPLDNKCPRPPVRVDTVEVATGSG
jgi:hypothetical protein